MINRTILRKIEKTVNSKPITLITGARQVGKSILACLFKDKGFNYVTLRNTREKISKGRSCFIFSFA